MYRRLVAATLALALVGSACASDDADGATTSGTSEPPVVVDDAGSRDAASAHAGEASGDDGADGTASDAHEARTVAGSAEEFDGDASSAVAPVPEPEPDPEQLSGLRAGWVDDNDDFADYLDYRERTSIAGASEVDVDDRQVIRVVDASGDPVAGAEVELRADDEVVHAALTHADGRAFAFPAGESGVAPEQRRRPQYQAVVDHDGELTMHDLDPGVDQHEIAIDTTRTPTAALDVLFLIDATGSMSDEIDQLKANMDRVAADIAAEQDLLDLRFAMVTYRDHGDDFLTRTTDFTDDVDEFQRALEQVEADGGGDNPEAVDEALAEAIDGVSWRPGEAISLVFLVADAPPHLDDPQNRTDYAAAALDANAAGIKVFPIASSGLDATGEYVFRQIAQLTGAPFVFLTYGAGGGPGTERPEFDVDDYSVLALDQLVVRLVTDEIGHQR